MELQLGSVGEQKGVRFRDLILFELGSALFISKLMGEHQRREVTSLDRSRVYYHGDLTLSYLILSYPSYRLSHTSVIPTSYVQRLGTLAFRRPI